MAIIKATFLVNDDSKEDRFVLNLPEDYAFQPGERLIERDIEETMYNLYLQNRQNDLKIFRYIDQLLGAAQDYTIPPFGTNFKTGLNTRLHHEPKIEPNGFLTGMKYYAQVENVQGEWVYRDLVVEAKFDYHIDPTTQYVYARVKEVIWYKEDGHAHPTTKKMYKVYTPLEMDGIAIKRRGNLISLVKLTVAKFISDLFKLHYPNPETRPSSNEAAKAFMAPLNAPIMNYINGGDMNLIKDIEGSTEPILKTIMPEHGVSVKDYISNWLRIHG
jgi:hypothetical protein